MMTYPMHHYCTLFDRHYLAKGLTMYQSLKKTGTFFHLYIFAFDRITLDVLEALKLDSVTPIAVAQMESEALRSVRAFRTTKEYCWTCTPFVIDYCLRQFDLPACTYVDADLYFFEDPLVLHMEAYEARVLITDHRYSKRYDQSATSGKYCVQFITFQRNAVEVLQWWCERCLEWCYDRFEEGKFGDQKYLDDWTRRFEGVHVLHHLGGGLAPWNVQQFKVTEKEDRLWVSNSGGADAPLIFYHFHGLKFAGPKHVDFGSYDLNHPGVMKLYQQYAADLINTHRTITKRWPDVTEATYVDSGKCMVWLKNIVRKGLGVYNVYRLSELTVPSQIDF